MAVGDGGPRWLVNQHIEVTKFTRTSPSFGASPNLTALEHRVLKGKTWISISGCPADQRRPYRLQTRVCRLRLTKRTWRAMAAAAQTAAAAEATAASLDLNIVDGRWRRLEARDTRHRAAAGRRLQRHLTRRISTAAACIGPKARKYDNPFGRLTIGQNDGTWLRKSGCVFGSSDVLALFWFLDFGDPSISNTPICLKDQSSIRIYSLTVVSVFDHQMARCDVGGVYIDFAHRVETKIRNWSILLVRRYQLSVLFRLTVCW
jgi:hypothetical protein